MSRSSARFASTAARHANADLRCDSFISLPGRKPALFQRLPKLPTTERTEHSLGRGRLRQVELARRSGREVNPTTRSQEQEPVATTRRINDVPTPVALQFSPRIRYEHSRSLAPAGHSQSADFGLCDAVAAQKHHRSPDDETATESHEHARSNQHTYPKRKSSHTEGKRLTPIGHTV
jgi:hypothetical protein